MMTSEALFICSLVAGAIIATVYRMVVNNQEKKDHEEYLRWKAEIEQADKDFINSRLRGPFAK